MIRTVGALRSSGPVTSEASRKLGSTLRALVADFQAEGFSRDGAATRGARDRFSSARLRVDDAGRVQVYVTLTAADDASLGRLRTAGVSLEVVNRDLRIVQGWAAVADLPALAARPDVVRIRPPGYGRPRTGPVTSEGDAIHRCPEVRAGGTTGAGVAVGVISDGVDGLASSVAAGELPPDVQVLAPGSGDEGTALLEIIHDCAPGATLLFAPGRTTLEFMAATNALRDAGAHVIVDDIGHYTEPYFADGDVARNSRAVAGQRVVVSAAGNDAQAHYQGVFAEGPLDAEIPGSRHDFGGGDTLVRVLFAGQPTFFLQWDDPFGGSENDYDLCARTTGGALIGCSADSQTGADDPLEVFSLDCPAATCAVDLQITRFAGAVRLLELFCLGACQLAEFADPRDAIFEHPAVPEVLAVGALRLHSPAEVETFSSGGPASVTLPGPEIRPKPDLVAVNCVATSRPGFSTFCGTSAAAPQVAAIAALLLAAHPALTPAQVRAVLKAGSVDLAGPGPDVLTGAGRVDAVVTLDAVPTVARSLLDVQLSGTAFQPGHAVGLFATLTPGLQVEPVDPYVVVLAPDGGVFSVRPDGVLAPGVVPFQVGLTPLAAAGQLVLYTFTGAEPFGVYRVRSGLARPGTLDPVSGLAEASFTYGTLGP